MIFLSFCILVRGAREGSHKLYDPLYAAVNSSGLSSLKLSYPLISYVLKLDFSDRRKGRGRSPLPHGRLSATDGPKYKK
jgi:hypothetical protein